MAGFNRSRLVSSVSAWVLATLFAFGTTAPARAAGDDKPDFNKLQRQLKRAYDGANYKKALEVAEKMHELRADDVSVLYNIACLHCLLGDKEKAYTWLEKAVRAGYTDADALVDDYDFRTIRGEDRFRALVRRIREGVTGRRAERESGKANAKPNRAKPAARPDKPKKPDAPKMSARERFQKIGELTQKLVDLSRKGNQGKALKIALEALHHASLLNDEFGKDDRFGPQVRGQLALTHYNVACMYSLVGKKGPAFEHLDKVIELGGFGQDLAEQIEDDSDFDNIRKDRRYADILKRAKKASARPARQPIPESEEVAFKWKVTLPEDFDKSHKAPLLVALHHFNGSMEKTTRRWKKAADEVGAILLTPQGTIKMDDGNYHWGRSLDKIDENVMAAINQVMDKYKIDQDKIILAGFSQGGWATWGLALRHPDTFRGIIPVAGRFEPESESDLDDPALAHLRVFIMVGAEDRSRTIDSNRKAAKLLRKTRAKVRLNIYDEVGHGFPDNETEEQIKALKFILGR